MNERFRIEAVLFRQPVGEDIEGQFLVGVGLQDRVAHAIERLVESQIGINPGADNCRVCEWADHALRRSAERGWPSRSQRKCHYVRFAAAAAL